MNIIGSRSRPVGERHSRRRSRPSRAAPCQSQKSCSASRSTVRPASMHRLHDLAEAVIPLVDHRLGDAQVIAVGVRLRPTRPDRGPFEVGNRTTSWSSVRSSEHRHMHRMPFAQVQAAARPQQRGDDLGPAARCRAASSTRRRPCRRDRMLGAEHVDRSRRAPTRRTVAAIPARAARSPRRRQAPLGEKSSPVTRAPRPRERDVSVPIWHCEMHGIEPGEVTEERRVERDDVGSRRVHQRRSPAKS